MTTGHQRPITAERLTAALIEVASTARWPDGSLLLDLDGEVLRAQRAPKLLAALDAPCPAPGAQQPHVSSRSTSAQPRPPQPSPPPERPQPVPDAPQEHAC